MSSTISLVIGAVGLLAAVFALIVVLRRPPARDQPAVAATPGEPAGVESASVTAAAQRTLAEAGQEADQVRARAQAEAAAKVREAGLASDKAAQASRDAEEELRAVRAEARDLRADLERREARLAERESRLDAEFGKLDERSASLDQIRSGLETRRADLDRLDEERRQVLEQTARTHGDAPALYEPLTRNGARVWKSWSWNEYRRAAEEGNFFLRGFNYLLIFYKPTAPGQKPRDIGPGTTQTP